MRVHPFFIGQKRRDRRPLDRSPHTIVKTAFRVHIRGYAYWRDGMDNRFIVIPGRVMEAKIDPLAGYVGASSDADWTKE